VIANKRSFAGLARHRQKASAILHVARTFLRPVFDFIQVTKQCSIARAWQLPHWGCRETGRPAPQVPALVIVMNALPRLHKDRDPGED